jgi:hypothetical protein
MKPQFASSGTLASNSPRVCNDLFVLQQLSSRRDGYFVEAGALDGIHGSNTWLLERDYGWCGICVEPDSGLFSELVNNRTSFCVKACLYSDRREVTFVEGVRGWGGIEPHLFPQTHEHWKRGRRTVLETTTLAEVLDEHRAPSVIDYLSLDTEGTEHIILKTFPFDRYTFRVVTIEGNRCNDLLAANGYRMVENPFTAEETYERCFLGPEHPN